MRISVKVIAGSKTENVEKRASADGAEEFVVRTRAVREAGKANDAVVVALAKYFEVKKSDVAVVRGHTASRKIIDVNNI